MIDLINPGTSGWCAILPKRTPHSTLTNDIEVDLLVVGAGFAGLAAATRAKQLQPHLNIAILESINVSESSAGRNSGFMIDLPHHLSSSAYAGQVESDRRYIRLNRGAIDFCEDVVKTFELPVECFSRSGKINAAATKKGHQHNLTYAQHLTEMEEPHTLLTQAEMQAITGIDYYQSGVQTPGTAMIQPALLIRSWADALAEKAHIQLYENSGVETLQKTANHWLCKTKQGSVKANQVILAVNGMLQQFGYYPKRLMHIPAYAAMTRPLTAVEEKQLGGQTEWALTPSDPMGTTVRKIHSKDGTRIALRNYFSYRPNYKINPRTYRRQLNNQRGVFAKRFTSFPDMEFEYQWAGRLCLSINEVSVIGEIEPNLFTACCQNGLGTTKGIISGIVAVEKALQATTTLIPDYQTEPAPKSLILPDFLLDIGANSYLAFKHWQAGKEN